MINYYDLLEIPIYSSSQEEIRKAYMKKVMYYHPDKGHVGEDVALEKTKLLNEAYDVLRDDEKKKAYDLALQQFIKYGSQTEYDRAIKAYEYFKKQKTNGDF